MSFLTKTSVGVLPIIRNTALYPLTDFFQRVLPWQQHEDPRGESRQTRTDPASNIDCLCTESVPLFASLLSLPLPENLLSSTQPRTAAATPENTRNHIAILLELAERQPVLFILEDLHWTDPSTLELLGLLLDQTPPASLLVLLSCRPHFQPAWHHRSYLTEITVNRLSQHQMERYDGSRSRWKASPDTGAPADH
jgi:hypothetical protein